MKSNRHIGNTLLPSVRRFSAHDMMRWARYLTNDKPDGDLRHSFERWFRGPQFDRPGINWNKPNR